MISIIHPSRGRPGKSFKTIEKFVVGKTSSQIELLVSVDEDDPLLPEYKLIYDAQYIIINKNRSAVDAINSAAKVAKGDVFFVVSDDTDCDPVWYENLSQYIYGRGDFILKTQDGIQDWIITNPILDRAYYNRTGYIYDPDFKHMFCDTWLTVQADISGRKLTSNLMFRHLNDTIKDAVRERSDATWQQGERTFIDKVKATPVEFLNKITDRGMKNWIRNKTGIRV